MDAGSRAKPEVVWRPASAPQRALLACPVFEVFFGGARGGGKTDAILGEWAQHASAYAQHAIGLMVRRTRMQLTETFERAKVLFVPIGAKFTEVPMRCTMPTGARLNFAYLERDSDADNYQGHSYTRVYVEEAGTFPSSSPIFKLKATLRSGAGVPCRMRLTGNPGGPGHQWVKARYIDPAPQGWEVVSDDTGLERVYIPSRVSDNPFLGPAYIAQLKQSGSPELVRAWLEGDFSVIAGAFFPEFSMDSHVVQPRSLPAYWHRFRSLDWGSARPFSVGWWAVSDGELPEFPRGALIRYREWYGASAPNVGLRMTAEEVADGIKIKEKGDVADGKTFSGVADPAIYSSDGGPSIADRMSSRGVYFRPADNSRVAKLGALGGWDQLRSRLKGDGETPAIYFFSTCVDTIRTLPALQHDEDRPEDVDSDGEDHAPDECFIAGTLVATDCGEVPIEDLRVGDLVNTRSGDRRISAVFSVGDRDVYEVKLSNGCSLTGTANHPVWVQGQGFVSLKLLRYAHILSPWSIQTNTEALHVASGQTYTDQFQLNTSSITSTTTNVTTVHPTWNVLRRLSTGNIIQSISFGLRRGVLFAASNTKHLRAGLTGLFSVLMRASQSSVVMRTLMMSNAHAGAAGSYSQQIDIPAYPIAPMDAPIRGDTRGLTTSWFAISATTPSSQRWQEPPGALTVVSEPTTVGRQRVYNLSVEDVEEYYANGVLVHNCRYACLSRPYTTPLPAELVPERDKYARKRAVRKTGSFMGG